MTHRKFLLGLVTLLILLAAAMAVAWIFSDSGSDGQLSKALEEARTNGLVVDLSELESSIPGPNPTALAAWKRADEMEFSSENTSKLVAARGWSEVFDQMRRGQANASDAAAALVAAKDKLDAYETAANFEPFTIERSWDELHTSQFPESQYFRNGIRHISARAVYLAQTGDVDGAIRDLRTCMRIFRLVSEQPFLVGKMAHIRTVYPIVQAVQSMAIILRGNSSALNQIENAISDFAVDESSEFLGHQLAGLRHATLLMRTQNRQPSEFTQRDIGFLDWYYVKGARAAEAMLTEYFVELAKVWPDPEAVRNVQREFRSTSAFLDPGVGLAKALVPRLDRFAVQINASDALSRVTRIGVAALRLRSESGNWPTLSEAAVAAGVSAADPFSEGPFKYRIQSNGLVVYSIGQNLRDDGGNVDRREGHDDYARFVIRLPDNP
jgi:hypothetical protein